MRGDRPYRSNVLVLQFQATPHARGSTLKALEGAGIAGGYPACAGIDRSWTDNSTPSRRLPRMRGDRPSFTISAFCFSRATPHARGSTHFCSWRIYRDQGYPACAGIDLCIGGYDLSSSGLPRMRGDRPTNSLLRGDMKTATPHARGSTCGGPLHTVTTKGYPACAGIDRSVAVRRRPRRRLPRMRGDRPFSTSPGPSIPQATPHARGSTFSTSSA